MFDPEKVKRYDIEGDDSWMSEHPRGLYIKTSEFEEMRAWWEERGKEIDQFYERLGRINAICEEGL